MDTVYGKVKKRTSNTYAWKLGSKTYENGWMSTSFSIPVYSDFFRFALKLNKSPLCQSGKLFLCKLDKKSSMNFDLNITLRYNCETEELSVKNPAITKRRKWTSYYLAEIKTSNLLEITCTFLKIGLTTETVHGTGVAGETSKQDEKQCISNEETISTRVKVDEESDINPKETESKKTKGEIALMENLKNIFLDEEDSDVILKVGEEKYPVHKVVIRARSSVFRAMLKYDMIEKNQGVVNIEDCDPYIFRDFLFYLYTGKLDNITNENVFELFYLSDKYDVRELRMDCTDFILDNLTIDTVCDAISLAIKHCEHGLLTHATACFVDNAKEVITTVKWQTFIQKNPIEANELFIKTLNKDNSK